MILPIVIYDDPILRELAIPVKLNVNVSDLVMNMFETMNAASGCGLAAPQVGLSLQLFVIEFPDSNSSKLIKKVFINPIITILEDHGFNSYKEGCLSIPGVYVDVKRPNAIHVSYYNEKWQHCKEKIDGFLARIILHESDHLFGKLHIDYAIKEDLERDSDFRELKKGNINSEFRYLMRHKK